MANETYNILQGIFNGQTPIQRSNPMSGQSNYYYMKPNQNSYTPLSQMQTVDVPSATTPNPYLREGYGNSYSKNSFGDYSAENTTDKNLTDKRVENIMNIARNGISNVKNSSVVDNILKMYKGNKQEIDDYQPLDEIGSAIGTLHAAYQDMNQVNLPGYDNYAHRLAMCINGQKGLIPYMTSAVLGAGKEGTDIIKNVYKLKPPKEIWNDAIKDTGNNFESLDWGLQNPNKSCIMWLKDLDYKNNVWRKNDTR